MHRDKNDPFPTLDKPREMSVLAVGMEHASLPDLADSFVEQMIKHKFIRGVSGKGSSPLSEFEITHESVFDVRTAAANVLDRRGIEGLSLSARGVKRAASKILKETKSSQNDI